MKLFTRPNFVIKNVEVVTADGPVVAVNIFDHKGNLVISLHGARFERGEILSKP